MALQVKFLNGSALNKEGEINSIGSYILSQGTIPTAGTDNLEITATEIKAGRCLISCTRTNTTPEETFLVLVTNPTDTSISVVANKKIYIEIPQANINDSTLNTSLVGEGVASIKIEDTFPAGNYIPLAETDGSINITDLRVGAELDGSLVDEINLTQLSGGNWKVLYTDGSGLVQEVALGTATQSFTSNGASSAPSFQSISVDINALDNDETLDGDDKLVFYNNDESKNEKRTAKASATIPGLVEMATDAEALAGTDEERYVNPKQALLRTGVETFTISTGTASGTQVVSHSLGFIPKMINIEMKTYNSGELVTSSGSYDGTNNKLVYNGSDGANFSSGTSDTQIVYYKDGGNAGDIYTGIITAVTSSNFTITWTKGATVGTNNLYMVATLLS